MNLYIFQKTILLKKNLYQQKVISNYFYPFDKMDFHKKGVESSWSVSDKDGIAIALATGKNPQAVTMSFQKEYAERYDWLVKEFSDWAFTLPQVSYIIWTTTVLMNRQKNCIVRVCLHLAEYPRLTISH